MSSENSSEFLAPWVRVGTIVACQALKGEVRVNPVDKQAEWIKHVNSVALGEPVSVENIRLKKIKSSRLQKNMVILKLEGVNDRNSAELLIGTDLFVERSSLPELEEGEYWADDLVGLTVIDSGTKKELGTVVDFVSSGNLDFLEIKSTDSEKIPVQTVPFNPHFVEMVNLEEKTLLLKGLAELFEP